MAMKNETLEQRTARLQKAAIARKQKAKDKLRETKAKEARKRANDRYNSKKVKARANQLKDWEANEGLLKDTFFEALKGTNGHLGNSIRLTGVDRSWYRKMVSSDPDFSQRVIDSLEELEDKITNKFVDLALDGNTWAGSLMYRRIAVQKAHIEYRQRLEAIHSSPISMDKEQALKFALKELLVAYYTLKSQGKDVQALSAMQRYIDLLKLNEISELGDYEILKGTKLIKIMDDLDIKPTSIETIKFEEIEDEEMKQHYKNIFPQDKLETNGN